MRRRAAAALALLALAGCGADERQSATTSPPPAETAPAGTEAGSAEPARTIPLSVYFLRDGKIAAARRPVPETTRVGTTALRALLAGPSDEERAAGLTSEVPAAVELLGLSIEDGVATVELSDEFGTGVARLAQVVYTVTQFPSVERVSVGDRLYERADFERVTPPILVESPVVGDTVRSPLHVYGTANTFEATFWVNVTDGNGTILAELVVTATSGSGERGTFDVTVPFEVDRPALGALVVFESSAADGSRIHVVEIPLRLAP